MPDTFFDVREGILAQVRDYEATRRRDPTLDRLNPTPAREPETRLRIALSDADLTGQVPLERITAILTEQRHIHLAQFYGIDLALQATREKLAWRTAELACMDLRPTRALESVVVRTRILHASEDRIRVEAWLLDATGKALKAILHLTQVWTDLSSGRATQHPSILFAFLRQVQAGPAEPVSLGTRAEEVTRFLREQR